MKLLNIGAENFWSFKSLSYTFEDKPIQVNGINLTDDDQDSNGSGKSALLAIIQLLWLNVQYVYMATENKPMVKTTLINFDAKMANIWGEIHCPVRKETLKVERTIKKVGSGAQLSVNGVIKYAFEDKMVDEIDKFILDWIDISKDDLLNFYFVNNEKHKSLYTSNNNKKLEVYNRFSNANIIDGIEDFVKEDVVEIEAKVTKAQTAIDKIHGEIASTERRIIAEEERNLKEELTERINGYKQKIEELKQQNTVSEDGVAEINQNIIILKKDIEKKTADIAEINKNLQKLDIKPLNNQLHQITEKRSKIRSKITQKDTQKVSFNKTIDQATEMLNEVERNIAGSVECPKCNFEFVVGKNDVVVSDEKETKKSIEAIIEEAKTNIASIKGVTDEITKKELQPLDSEESKVNTKISEFNQKLRLLKNQVSNMETEMNNTTSSLKRKELSLTTTKDSIQDKLSTIKSYEDKIVEAQKEDTNENVRIKELNVELAQLYKDLKVKELELSLVNDSLFETKQWIINFKKFKGHLAGKSLKVIQGHLNKYLENMNSDIRIRMEGFKENQKGDIKDEITAYVLRGDQIRLFGSFSGGERGRMIYSELLTFMHIINSTNKWGGLWTLVSDEITEKVDGQGLVSVMKSLNEFKFPILVITHVVDRSVNDNKLIVTKTNGVSTIEHKSNFKNEDE
jgi:exonuclease SbcC